MTAADESQSRNGAPVTIDKFLDKAHAQLSKRREQFSDQFK